MGMAASQARYLALVARKSNCEYEGQQINQARLNLSNQSANLFNQMLGLNVPTPPSTQDFTTTQYSFTDGINAVTIDSWKQLATPEEDYNYVVNYHYNADVYTGAQKKLNDPQVQFSTDKPSTDLNELIVKSSLLTSSATKYNAIKDDYEKLQANLESAKKTQESAAQSLAEALAAKEAAEAAKDEANTALQKATEKKTNYKTTDYDPIKNAYDDAKADLDAATTAKRTKSSYSNGNIDANKDTITHNDVSQQYVVTKGDNTYTYQSYSKLTDEAIKTQIEQAIQELQANGVDLGSSFNINDDVFYDSAKKQIAFKSDLDKALVATENTDIALFKIGTAEEDDTILKKSQELKNNVAGKTAAFNDAEYKYNIVNTQYQQYVFEEDSAKATYDIAQNVLLDATQTYITAQGAAAIAATSVETAQKALDEFEEANRLTINGYKGALDAYNSVQMPEYIGNCKLTYLETLTEDQMAEIKQIVTDMKAQDINADINSCFDENGNYTGGIYKFTMNGVTYYSALEGLYDSYNTGTGINNIDTQDKLPYYNATYVSTKIEDTKKALLETDSQGRFSSIRLGDDTITYSLNVETITDDVAYQDAMNQYYYENAQYDKMIQDINAKTSLIQQEDQQLELRLKQLDTEQNALSQEMEAVQKVVKDNVEKSFKTFGG